MYESLLVPSCTTPAAFPRGELLASELEAVGQFEHDLVGTPANMHIRLAKADAELEAELQASCRSPRDAESASTLVDMIKKDVRRGIEQMRGLAPELRPLELSPASIEAGSRFRFGARRIIESVEPLCQLVSGESDGDVTAPARERVEEFERGLAGSELALQFDIAKADVRFEQSITLLECVAPAERDLETVREELLTTVERLIADLEAL